jgi:hypothetical protein
MATTGTQQVQQNQAINPAALSLPERPAAPASAARYTPLPAEKKLAGYGMPCSHCHAYYPSDMQSCPICKCGERVAPTDPVSYFTAAPAPPTATAPQLDAERERLLEELKSHASAAPAQVNATPTFRCVLAHQHHGSVEPAAVCHSCYSEVRQQADRIEAALHIDPKEAAKIVYEAVWADTSNPQATYLNAAKALLTELRNRAGIGLTLGSHQPMAH